jgi:hypothetical protein
MRFIADSAWMCAWRVGSIVKEFITIWTILVTQRRRGEPFQARAMGLCLVGHLPVPRGGHSVSLGLNAFFRFGCPRSPRLVPCLL